MKTYVHTKPYTGMFTRALFIMAKRWEQLKCLSPNEWLNKIGSSSEKEWGTDTCYNMNTPWKHYVKWKPVTKRPHVIWFTCVECKEYANLETESKWAVVWGWGRG